MNNLYAETCVKGVRELISWASDWSGSADNFIKIAKKKKLTVNHDPKGCNSDDPCILYYHPNYGYLINSDVGHVAVIYNDSPRYIIKDSNGVCGGGDKASCKKRYINFEKASIIHPPEKTYIKFNTRRNYETSTTDKINLENNIFSGCLKYNSVSFTEGYVMVIQAGAYHQRIKLNPEGCFNISNLNIEKPFNIMIRKSSGNE